MAAIVTAVISGAFSLIAVAVALWATTGVRGLRKQFRENLVKDRVAAYRSLWAKLAPLSFMTQIELSEDQRRELATRLTDWYFDDGNGVYLSQASNEWFRAGRKHLLSSDDLAAVRDTFSRLRSHLKDDIGVFGPGDWDSRGQRREPPPDELRPY